MAVPKRKTTPARRGKRRSHHFQLGKQVVECENCGELKLAHHVCQACGYYNKKEILDKTDSAMDESDSESEN